MAKKSDSNTLDMLVKGMAGSADSPTGMQAYVGGDLALPDAGQEAAKFPHLRLLHKQSEIFEELSSMGLKHGQLVVMNADVVDPDGPTHVAVTDPAFFMLDGFGPFWNQHDATTGTDKLAASEPAGNRSLPKDEKYKEQILLLGLLVTEDRKVYPIRWRGMNWTGVKPFKPLIRALANTDKPEWAGKSPAHADAAKIPAPRLRAWIPLQVEMKSGFSGGTYGQLVVPQDARPTKAEHAQAFAAWSQAGEPGLAEASAAFNAARDHIRAKLEG